MPSANQNRKKKMGSSLKGITKSGKPEKKVDKVEEVEENQRRRSKSHDHENGQLEKEHVKESFEFANKNYSKHLSCYVCKQLMVDPKRIHPCGCTFCLACIFSAKSCPKCLQKVKLFQDDFTGINLINQMIVKCLNEGCPYKGSYEEYKKFHQKSCKLQKGGLEEWLKNLKGTIEETNTFSSQLGVFNEESDSHQNNETIKKQIKVIHHHQIENNDEYEDGKSSENVKTINRPQRKENIDQKVEQDILLEKRIRKQKPDI